MTRHPQHEDNHSGTRKLTDRIGLITLALLFVVAVSLSNTLFRGIRIDLTENNLYTLSDGTVRILQSLQEPVHLQLYYSATASGDEQLLRGYAERAETLLREFSEVAEGNVRISIIDPVPFTEEEDRAQALGLTPVYLENEPIYLGIVGNNSTDGEELIPFLDISRETFLEYDLARLVYSLANRDKPVLGIISSLPITGGFEPATGRIEAPWRILTQLEQLFEWRSLELADGSLTSPLVADISTLLIIHPAELSAATLYAIEQFIFAGGNALILLDPFAESTLSNAVGAPRSSEFKLFDAWGLQFDPNSFVGDEAFALPVLNDNGQTQRHPGLIGVQGAGLSSDSVISSGIDSLNLGFAGAFSVAGDAVITLNALLQSSSQAALLPSNLILQTPNPADFSALIPAASKPLTLAAVVSGRPTSAFAPRDTGHITQASAPINVVVVGDTDLLTDRYWTQAQNYFGQSISIPFAGNADFIINILDNLSGSNDLIGMRSRAVYTRPFTRVSELRRQAENEFRLRREQLENELAATEARLEQLQNGDNQANGLLNEDQQSEINLFIEKRQQIRKDLRTVQRNLNRNIEALGTQLLLINTLLIPLLVALTGIATAIYRRRQHVAQRTKR
jgi:ABC-type uncharacterized transport system involved in gliding motility auxiliary subunit